MAHHLLQNTKQCFSLSDIDPNPYFDSMIGFHHDDDDDVFTQLPPGPGVNLENYPGLFINPDETTTVVNSFTAQPNEGDHKQRKRKLTMDIDTPETSSAYSSPQGSEITKTNRSRRGKKAKRDEKEDEKPREVVHVRAKRGQATDSHSLAERVRRKKINERLRCLQDIVPGCYKTMGMAVMLDEIINYVQSLQSQVEFLSMRLTAASTFYDCNSDADAMETVQRAKVFEAMNVQDTPIQGFSSAQFGN